MENREIKFRVWWVKSKRMIDEDFVITPEKWEKLCNEDKELAKKFTGLAIGLKIPASEILARFYDCPKMQCIGSKDNSGVEVYKEDIVEFSDDEWRMRDKNSRYAKIVWNRVNFAYYYLYPNGEREMVADNPPSLGGFVKVIGNVYQNPEYKKII